MSAVFLVLQIAPDLWMPGYAMADGRNTVHRGTVLSVMQKTGSLVLIIRDERGFKIRGNWYGVRAVEFAAGANSVPSDIAGGANTVPSDAQGGANTVPEDAAGGANTVPSDSDDWAARAMPGSAALIGTDIEYRAMLEEPKGPRNPHCFNYRNYLRSEGVYLTGTIRAIKVTGRSTSPHHRYKAFLQGLKDSFRSILPEHSRGMIMGMLFGDTQDLDEEIYDDFKRNGTAHVLAVSGLHVGILFKIYEKLTGGRTRPREVSLLIFLLYTYGTLAGWRPSVVRAEIMIIMKTAARIKCLRYDSLTAMSFTAILLILANPYVICGPGFQLSFLAITAINVVLKIMPAKVPDSIAQALAVNMVTLLYQAYVFNFITPLAVFINIPILYLAGISLPVSLATFAGYSLATGLSGVLAKNGLAEAFAVAGQAGLNGLSGAATQAAGASWYLAPAVSLAELLIRTNTVLSLGGKSTLDVISPPQWVVVFGIAALVFGCSEYALILRIRQQKTQVLRLLALIAAAGILVNILCYEPLSHDQVVFVDVGQGACTHLRAGGIDALIDGGGARDFNVGQRTLKPYLLKNGARDLDLALATHEDMDHIQGLRELRDCFRVKNFRVGCVAGESYSLGEGVTIQVLWPLTISDGTDKQSNEESSVFMVNYGGVRILITGDLDQEGEHAMIAHYRAIGRPDALRADVLNVGHHGSKSSTSDELLEAVVPAIAVIQVGKNFYGHPTKEVLERLKAHGARIFRNDEAGAVGLRLGRKGFLGLRGEWGIQAVHVMIG